MFERGRRPPNSQAQPVEAPGTMWHRGPRPAFDYPGSRYRVESLPPPIITEKQLAVQETEIRQLASDNRRLGATHSALREDLAAAQREIERIKAHTRSIQTESDIQVRVLMDKMAKMGADIQAGEGIEKELEQAHVEAQGLVVSRQELTSQVQKAAVELQKAHSDVERLPDMRAELNDLREEHRRLRGAFEYDKGLNLEEVEKMQAMEKKMVGMAREIEKLRAEVLNAEKRAPRVPHYGGAYMNSDASFPSTQSGAATAHADAYGRPYPHMGVGFAGDGNS